MIKKFLCIVVSILLIMGMSTFAFADEKIDISVLKQFVGEVIDIPLTATDDPNTEADETTNTVYGKEEGYKYTTGDVKEGDDDLEYNYKVITILKRGAIKVKTTNVAIEKNSKNAKLDYLHNETDATDDNNLKMDGGKVTVPSDYKDQLNGEYEYLHLGSEKYSQFLSAFGWNEKQPGASDDIVYSDLAEGGKYSIYVCNAVNKTHSPFFRGGYVVPRLYLDGKTIESEDGKGFPARWADLQQFVLVDADGNLLSAYCADQGVNAYEGRRYKIENLEDATYYTAEEAAKIRTIAYNGYWGTSEGIGSLDSLKKKLKDEGVLTKTEADNLTDGMAMTATQYAVWTYSNAQKGKGVYYNAYYQENDEAAAVAADKEDTDIIFKVYRHLVNLDPTESVPKSQNQRTIINEKNFIEKASMKITDSMKNAPENKDEDDTNDVFKADVSFVLSMTPEELKGDELVMYIKDGEGNVLATGRIAGKQKDNEVQLTPDKNNEYTFKDVPMHEGEQNIMFELSGNQELDLAAYLLTSEELENPPQNQKATSQTFVCYASGNREVNMVMDITCEITVDAEEFEENHTYKNPPNDPSGERETGDAFNLLLVVTILLISLAGAGLVLSRRKYN